MSAWGAELLDILKDTDSDEENIDNLDKGTNYDKMTQCGNCHAESPKGTAKCPKCGHLLSNGDKEGKDEYAKEKEVELVKCPNCDNSVSATADKCPVCKHEMPEKTAAIGDVSDEDDNKGETAEDVIADEPGTATTPQEVAAEHERNSTLSCPNCGVTIPAESAKCPSCSIALDDQRVMVLSDAPTGDKLADYEDDSEDPNPNVPDFDYDDCPNCGRDIEPTDNFCPFCGSPLKDKKDADVDTNKLDSEKTSESDTVETELTDEQKGKSEHPVKCPECGLNTTVGTKECPSCGHAIPVEAQPAEDADVSTAGLVEPEKIATVDDKAAQEERAKKYGISIKDGAPVTKPGKWKNVSDNDFLDPVNYAYPVHDAAHARNAAARWANSDNQSAYSDSEKAIINRRLEAALKKFKIGEFKDDKSITETNKITSDEATALSPVSETQPEQLAVKGETENSDVVNGEVEEDDKSIGTEEETPVITTYDFSEYTDEQMEELLMKLSQSLVTMQKKKKKHPENYQHMLAGAHYFLLGAGYRGCSPSDPDHDGDTDMDNDADDAGTSAGGGAPAATASASVDATKDTIDEENVAGETVALEQSEEEAQLVDLLKETKEELERVNSEYEKAVAELQTTKDAIRDRAAVLNRQDDEISAKELRLTELNAELETKHKEIESIDTEIQTKSEERDARKAEVETAETELKSIQDKHADAKKEYEILMDRELPSPVANRMKSRAEPKRSYGASMITRTTRENISRDRS